MTLDESSGELKDILVSNEETEEEGIESIV